MTIPYVILHKHSAIDVRPCDWVTSPLFVPANAGPCRPRSSRVGPLGGVARPTILMYRYQYPMRTKNKTWPRYLFEHSYSKRRGRGLCQVLCSFTV